MFSAKSKQTNVQKREEVNEKFKMTRTSNKGKGKKGGKGKGKKPSSDRLVMKAKQSKEMKAKVNPFERNFTKEKHKVFNR